MNIFCALEQVEINKFQIKFHYKNNVNPRVRNNEIFRCPKINFVFISIKLIAANTYLKSGRFQA